MRTDNNNNPTAFTVDLAKEAGLVYGVDYDAGDVFPAPSKLVTARLIGNPITVTLKLIDKVGFYTSHGQIRWIYIGMPKWMWDKAPLADKIEIIRFMYKHEGGTELNHFFPAFPINVTLGDKMEMKDKLG